MGCALTSNSSRCSATRSSFAGAVASAAAAAMAASEQGGGRMARGVPGARQDTNASKSSSAEACRSSRLPASSASASPLWAPKAVAVSRRGTGGRQVGVRGEGERLRVVARLEPHAVTLCVDPMLSCTLRTSTSACL